MNPGIRDAMAEREEYRDRVREAAALKRQWVLDSELTGAQLLERHRQLKRDYYERQARRAA